MSEENRALVRKYFETQDRERRTPTELCAPGFTAYIAGNPAANPTADLEAFQQNEEVFFTGFSNIRHRIEDLVAEGDRVAFRMTMDFTHTGEFMGIPATGKQISFSGIGIMRIADGKIAEFWGNPDVMSFMQQLGALPQPVQTGSAQVRDG